jgi:hypothetical protein
MSEILTKMALSSFFTHTEYQGLGTYSTAQDLATIWENLYSYTCQQGNGQNRGTVSRGVMGNYIRVSNLALMHDRETT